MLSQIFYSNELNKQHSMKYILISLFLININIFAQNIEKDSLEFYSFKDFSDRKYKVTDFKDKYILVTQITDDADSAMIRRYLQHYEKIAKNKPNWVFINVIWSDYTFKKNLSIDKALIHWKQVIKKMALKNINNICLYENADITNIAFSRTRLVEYIIQYCFYINKDGEKIPNIMNNWTKDASANNIQEFKNIFDFFENLSVKLKYKPRR